MTTIPNAEIAKTCRKYHIRRLRLFGSVLRDDFCETSDIDVLAEFEPDYSPGWEIVDVAAELGRHFGNRKVDLVNPKYLNGLLHDEILKTAKVVYEAEG